MFVDLTFGLGFDVCGELRGTVFDAFGALNAASGGGDKPGRHCGGAHGLAVALDYQRIDPGVSHGERGGQTGSAAANDDDGNVGDGFNGVRAYHPALGHLA